MADLELLREAEWRKCKGTSPQDWAACLYWCENFVKIRHPEKGRIAFELREAQVTTLQAWLTHRYNVTLKARQIGYSTLSAALSLWLTFFWEDKPVIMLSRGEREANSLLKKSKYAYQYMPEWMRVRGPQLLQNTQSRMAFANESSIDSLPSTQDPARGETAYLIVVDEWAFLENPEEAWASIEPVADVGGRVIGLSTANGSGNFFHTFWQQACNGKGKFKPLFFPWSANSDRDETWYEEKADDLSMTPWVLFQEYPRNADEAFIKSGRSVFDIGMLDKLPLGNPQVGDVTAATPESRYAEWRDHVDGPLKMYAAPTPGTSYVIGADVAEGLEHGDYSSAHVIDVGTMQVAAVWHGHVEPDLFGQVLAHLGYFYGTALVGVEVNNHGLTTCTALQRLRYPRIYYRTSIDQQTKKRSKKIGWRTQQNTKPYLIDQLARVLRGEKTVDEHNNVEWSGGLGVYDERTISELRLYVREPDGKKMHGSPHDDRVMSLAIAVEMTAFAHAPQFLVKGYEDEWTLEWWANTVADPSRGDPMRIGQHSVRKGR